MSKLVNLLLHILYEEYFISYLTISEFGIPHCKNFYSCHTDQCTLILEEKLLSFSYNFFLYFLFYFPLFFSVLLFPQYIFLTSCCNRQRIRLQKKIFKSTLDFLLELNKRIFPKRYSQYRQFLLNNSNWDLNFQCSKKMTILLRDGSFCCYH